MPALAHIGVGLGFKRIEPQIPLWGLIIGSMLIDILSMVLFFTPIWTSHSLIMGFIWSALFSTIIALILKKKSVGNYIRISVVYGFLIFSHTIMDLLGWPMFFQSADTTGIPLLFSLTPTFGLGLYKLWYIAIPIELIALFVGIRFYQNTIKTKK